MLVVCFFMAKHAPAMLLLQSLAVTFVVVSTWWCDFPGLAGRLLYFRLDQSCCFGLSPACDWTAE